MSASRSMRGVVGRSGVTNGRARMQCLSVPVRTAEWPSRAIASSWKPTTLTSSRSTASPANSCGIPNLLTRARTTLPHRPLFRQATWSSLAFPGVSTVQTDSSQLTIRRQARRSGGSQPYRDQENQDPRRGKERTSSMVALRPGSPAATIPSSTLSTGQPAIPARSTTVIIAQDGTTEVVLPIHATRSVGLGRYGNSGLGGCGVAGPDAEAYAAGQPQWILLRLRSPRRHPPPGQTVRQVSNLGKRDRTRRASHQASQPGTHARGHQSVPFSGWSDQLVFPLVQSRDQPLLRSDV